MSGNELDPQNPPLMQELGFTQISESRNEPLQNTTTDMLSELAVKFHTMKKLQSLIKDFFAQDQKCCIEFLEKMLEELKKPQNVQASAGLRVTAPKVEENRTNVNIVTQNTTTIINSNESIQETLPSTARNTNLVGENYHSVDESLHEKMWSLANRISDSVTRALMLDEAPNDVQKSKQLQPRVCYHCRIPGHFAADCPKNRNNASTTLGGFSEDEFHRIRKSRYNKFEGEFERGKYTSRKSEVDYPPYKKSKVCLPDLQMYRSHQGNSRFLAKLVASGGSFPNLFEEVRKGFYL